MSATPIASFLVAVATVACTSSPPSSTPGGLVSATPTEATPRAVTISGPSPFAQCNVGRLLSSSHVYAGAEVEPSLAVNPVDPANLIAAYQQDRWSDGAARGIVVASTTDGGDTWRPQSLPFSQCAGGDPASVRVGDPWVVYGSTGSAWVIATGSDGVHAALSTDKGAHWQASVVYKNPQGRSADKPSIAADPVLPMVAYAAWYTIDRAASTTSSWIAITTDGGKSWSPASRLGTSEPLTVAGETRSLGPVSPLIIAGPTPGVLYVFAVYEPFSTVLLPPFALGFQRSADGGHTWSRPRVIQDILTVGQTVNPNSGHAIRTGTEVVGAASDPQTGSLYVVWQDARFEAGRFDEVAISRSADSGDHWSAPVRVHSTQGVPGVLPAIATDPAGHVAIAYLDWRALQPQDGSTLHARYWLAESDDQAAHFRERPVSGQFDMMAAPDAGGKFVGDYFGLAPCRQGFCMAYATTNSSQPDNPTDILFSALPA